jgi:hypothetical protein
MRTAELRELVQEVLNARRQGNVHEDTDTITAILVEMQVGGQATALCACVGTPHSLLPISCCRIPTFHSCMCGF